MAEEIKVLGHVLVPKHEVMSKEEVEEMLKKFKVRPYQLPNIFSSDPAAVEIGAKAGQIIKITRKSQTAGNADIYRLVVEE